MTNNGDHRYDIAVEGRRMFNCIIIMFLFFAGVCALAPGPRNPESSIQVVMTILCLVCAFMFVCIRYFDCQANIKDMKMTFHDI